MHWEDSLNINNIVVALALVTAAPVYGSTWNYEMEGIGTMRADGTLYLKLLVGEADLGDTTLTPIYAVYSYDANRTPAYQWRVPQLSIAVVPDYSIGWQVTLPSGRIVRFPADVGWQNGTGLDIDSAGSGWFFADDGWVFEFRRGLLCTLRSPSGQQLNVDSRGKFIRSITATGRSDLNLSRLTAEYNGRGAMLSFQASGEPTNFIYDTEDRLTEIWRGKTRYLKASYNDDGTVQQATIYDNEAMSIDWCANNTLMRILTGGVAGKISFRKLGDATYTISLSQKYSRIRRTEHGHIETVTFNRYRLYNDN